MRPIIITLFMLIFYGCNGGGGGSSPTTGTLTIAITDASIDDYDEALLEVSSITLIGSGGQETELLDDSQTIDLLKLRNVSELLLRKTLTARSISKIRLGVDSITLNKLDMSGDITDFDSPPVPTRKIDLNPQGSLEVRAGEDLLVMLDVDLDNSIKINETGNEQVRFRPLVKITAGISGLVRLYGTYTVDGDSTSICDLQRVSDADDTFEVLNMCVVLDETNTNYFGITGLPLNPDDPSDPADLMEPEKISVYGSYVESDDGPILMAEIIARGTGNRGESFRTLDGIVTTPWNSDSQRFEVAVTEETNVVVELSDGGKVFNLDGEVLDPMTAIAVDARSEARGAWTEVTNEDSWLQAFVAFVSEDTGNDNASGEIRMDDGIVENTINLIDDGDPVTFECVEVNPNTAFYQTEVVDDVSNLLEIDFEALMEGDLIDVSGDLVAECIQARTIVKTL